MVEVTSARAAEIGSSHLDLYPTSSRHHDCFTCWHGQACDASGCHLRFFEAALASIRRGSQSGRARSFIFLLFGPLFEVSRCISHAMHVSSFR